MVTKTETARWGEGEREHARADEEAGLLLLYAPDFEALPSAVPLPEGGLVIGRAPPAGALCVPHAAVSQMHARILRKGDRWALKDMGSRNGTLVNGRVQREALLEGFDQLRFGDAIFELVEGDVRPYQAYRIDGSGPEPHPFIVGGHQIRSALRELESLAATSLSLLVTGETGTGKELFARAAHRASGRTGAMVALNCAAIPATLVETELFGFKRGAFSGADRDKVGLVASAQRGTLFLDEIGDMPLEAQTKLLRVLETREVLPVGATSPEPVDVRFVCATHHDLQELADAGRFRGDLLARLRGAVVEIPPLRERKEDLYALVLHFLAQAGAPKETVTPAFMAGALQWDWPHNVRELDAAVRRALALAKGAPLALEHLPEPLRERMRGYGTSGPSDRAPAPAPEELRALLERHKGNVSAVARELKRDRVQIHRWMRYAGIDPEKYRS
jgi:DNA-binding NtrC family response regulator